MRIGERIAERRKAKGLSQGALAERAGLSQPTIGKLESGISSGSSFMHRIARELDTTPAYLAGETDNPALDAPSPPPVVAQQVMMPVSLPSENALAGMFEGLLLTLHELQPITGWQLDELGRELAQLLPTGLSRLQGRLIELPRPPRHRSGPTRASTEAEVHPSDDRELQR